MIKVEHARPRFRSSRATVGRDTITILAGALLAVIAGNLAGFGAPVGDLSSPTPEDTSLIIGNGSLVAQATFPPIETLGQIVNPSTGFQATPTPIPIITLGPSPTPGPSASAGASAKPTPKPTTKPTPTPTPTPTPIQAVAAFTCVVTDLTLTCTDQSTNAATEDWDWGDGFHTLTVGDQSHTYLAPGSYTVILTVTPLGPSFSATHTYTVTAPPSP